VQARLAGYGVSEFLFMERVIFVGSLFGGGTNGGSHEAQCSCNSNHSFDRGFVRRFRAKHKLSRHDLKARCEFSKGRHNSRTYEREKATHGKLQEQASLEAYEISDDRLW